MIELGSAPAQSAAPIKEVSEATFMADVIDGSMNGPVIAYFTAAWCGPCKTLGPMLEETVRKAKGAVTLCKIDVDQNQQMIMALAQQGLPLQSVPTVVAFDQGRPVDMFQGAVPQSQITEFVNKLAKGAGGNGLDEALEAAEEMLEQGAAADAAQTFAAVLGEEPENPRALGGLIRATVAAGDIDQAKTLLGSVPAALADDPAIAAARGAVELAEQTQDAGEVGELRARLEADGNDHQARFDLSTALLANNDRDGAVEELLELFRRDREWNDGAAKAQLFTLFDTFGAEDPLTLKGRRRLSSMIFA
ncbi:MAG: tetratricopeptide repeat protein [Pseudomonadota bacterium]